MSKNFLITGVSTGLGRAIAQRALAAGHRVAGTVRTEKHAAEFRALDPERARAFVLDLTEADRIEPAVRAAETELGRIDVLVANAGYGLEGTFEESSMEELRRQFEVNVFGTVATIKAVLPAMRERRDGQIFVITSMGGHTTFPGLAFYEGSKHALEGITDTLAQEVGQFGVRVTAVAPGAFKTDWAGRSLVRAPRSIADYDALFDPIRTRRQALAGQGIGDPARAGDAILSLLDEENPPVHLLLGSDALRLVTAGRQRVQDDFDAWQDLTLSTDSTEGGVTVA
ncbi:oxidoreductase [Amycolatopsis sp. AA4]|uniref:oxidoreductase n=1 Tax=Actinomycetes TaxID=1760 RepID=UPI0001B5756D|nr:MULTISPECIES: oxidoreductase [Actinomycetes]ATY12805.1 oxidoreductase [Amycolatopsis sp. AA4]EFL08629.1 2-hydroxycyclohexanecarboxyl-CoA dehydrogenase [Streptomyces sp. AA4]